MPDQVYRYPVVRPADPRELREARRERLRLAAASDSPLVMAAAVGATAGASAAR